LAADLSKAHVRFGSQADISLIPSDVRFTPESGHRLKVSRCPLCAMGGHMRCGKLPSWSGYHYGIRLGLLRSQPNDDIDAGDLVAVWRLRGLTNEQSTHGDVHEFIFVLDEKVVVRGIVGVEVGFGRIDRDLA
jgi:hypothetical protein